MAVKVVSFGPIEYVVSSASRYRCRMVSDLLSSSSSADEIETMLTESLPFS